MRVALLSSLGERYGEPGIGLQPFAGRSVLALQVDAALALGCERIVCLAESASPEIAELQRQAESANARFNAITAHRTLSGMVSANDEVLVLAPGLLIDGNWLADRFSQRPGLAVLPIEIGLEHGFERIDRDRAWGGALLVRGDAVEALTALPPDGDAVAGLLRIALQRGVRAIPVPESSLDDGRWSLVRSENHARRLEALWLGRHVPSPGFSEPGDVGGYVIARFLSGKSRSQSWPLILSMMAILLAIGGGVAGWSGRVAGGLIALMASAALGNIAYHLYRFIRSGKPDGWIPALPGIRNSILDIALVALSFGKQDEGQWYGVYVALVLVVAMRLSEEATAPMWARPFADRFLVISLALIATLSGFPVIGMGIIALVVLFLRLVKPFTRS